MCYNSYKTIEKEKGCIFIVSAWIFLRIDEDDSYRIKISGCYHGYFVCSLDIS